MDTLLDIAIFCHGPREGKYLLRRSFQHFKRLEQLFNVFDPESEVSRLNRMSGRGPVYVEQDLYHILRIAVDLFHKTEGAFDVTVGPLISVYSRAADEGQEVQPASLERALSLVGADKIDLLPPDKVKLVKWGMAIDLGGIAKGYALDKVITNLRQEGVERIFINFGLSSIFALGPTEGEEAWPVLVKGFAEDEFAGLVELRDQALSASSTFGRSFTIVGRDYSRLVDPDSGRPLNTEALAVVIAPSAAQAEALSTALLVSGIAGLAVIERASGCEGLYIDNRGVIKASSGIGKVVPFEPAEGWEVQTR